MQNPLARPLTAEGLLTEEQVEAVLAEAAGDGKSFGAAITESRLLPEKDLLQFFSRQLNLPIRHIDHVTEISRDTIDLIPAHITQKYKCLPLAREGRTLVLGVNDPTNLDMLEEVAFVSGCRLRLVLLPERELLEAIEQHYDVTVQKLVEGMAEQAAGENSQEQFFIHDLQEKASEPTLINLVNLIISDAVNEGASDIHIEPFEREMKIKYRVDGILQEVPPPPKNLQPAIVSRVKIMAGMDIAKRHIPQDGHIRINHNKAQVDIRVATVPTIFGEGVVMRLLNKSAILISMEDLGFSAETYERIQPLLEASYGMMLVCGPTGSGKTTTLYAILNKIFTPEKKIITIEDPVEYQLDGVNQIPVKPQRGVTFATGLRSILRLDPDVLLVGEIRDVETAEIAIRSALTGHLIFSTLHTNDAASAVTRLLDMGVEPYLIASSLQAVVAQRLIRLLCKECRVAFDPEDYLLGQFEKVRGDARGATFYRAVGCDHCKNRGYLGRMGIFELLEIDEQLRQMITNRDASHTIKAAAIRRMTTMREDGWLKVAGGLTTFEEVFRQTQREQAEEKDVIAALDE